MSRLALLVWACGLYRLEPQVPCTVVQESDEFI
jgi:hypothetical protein